jgi:hypothetical protein
MCVGVWKNFKRFTEKRGGNVVDLGIGNVSIFTCIYENTLIYNAGLIIFLI